MKPSAKARRHSASMGSVYERQTSKRLYISLPRRVARDLNIPRDIATGIVASPHGWMSARRMLEDLIRRWQIARGVVRDTTAAITLAEAFERFLADHGARRSRASLRNYKLAWQAVICHGNAHDPVNRVVVRGSVQCSTAELAMAELVRTCQTPTGSITIESVAIYLRTFMVFCNWANREGLMPIVPRASTIRKMMPHRPGKPVQIYTDTEIEAMLAICRRPSAPKSQVKVGHIIAVLARTPLRLHEALALKREDIDTTAMTIRVERKDARTWEYIPLTGDDIALLARIAQENGVQKPHDAILGYHSTSDSRLRRTLYEVMHRAGIERNNRSWHEFKKTYISRVVRRIGTDLSIFEASRLARCSAPVLERHYLKLEPHELRQKIEKMWKSA
ncbi:MAG: site-specific integrase [Ignavibacteria bacterium]|nr:site-specific integrase [Ignavibacteria bacterium]